MRPNVFAGPHVDRLKFANADADSVARAIAEGSARLIPVWKSRCPVVRLPSPAACLLPFDSGPFAGIDVNELILLGEYQGLAILTTEIEGETPPALENGAEFADLRLAAALLPHEEAGLVAYARAMISFRHRHRFCGSCGAPTAPQQNGRVMVCQRKGCETESFPRVDPAVIVLVTDGDRALLGRQPAWPAGRYSTIAGFVEPGESLEDAVRREVLEETGIETGAMIYQSSQPWPFPRSLMLGFRAEALTTEIRPPRPRTRGRPLVPSRGAEGRLDDAVFAVDRVSPDPGMAEPLSILLSVATGLALAAAAGFRAFVPLARGGPRDSFRLRRTRARLRLAGRSCRAGRALRRDRRGNRGLLHPGRRPRARPHRRAGRHRRRHRRRGRRHGGTAGMAALVHGDRRGRCGRDRGTCAECHRTREDRRGVGRSRQSRLRDGGARRFGAAFGLAFLLPAIAFAAIVGCGAWALQRWRRRRV